MIEWHHQHSAHEFEQALEDSAGQGNLACCSPMRSQRVVHDLLTEKSEVKTDL